MIGTIILWILAVLLAALLVLLLLPASVRFTYDRGALTLGVRFGPVKRQLFPKPEAPEKQEKPKKEKPAKKEKPKKEKPKKPKAKINMEQILYSLETLPPILGRALKRTGKRIRVRPLKVYLLVAGGDPADTAALLRRQGDHNRPEGGLLLQIPGVRVGLAGQAVPLGGRLLAAQLVQVDNIPGVLNEVGSLIVHGLHIRSLHSFDDRVRIDQKLSQ